MKKILLGVMLVATTSAMAMTMPKVMVEGNVGGGVMTMDNDGIKHTSFDLGLGATALYNTEINDKFDIDYGVGVKLADNIIRHKTVSNGQNGQNNDQKSERMGTTHIVNGVVTARGDLNYKLGDKKLYVGVEAGLGTGYSEAFHLVYEGKVHSGVKFEKINVGAYGKVMGFRTFGTRIMGGVELGYTF